MFFVGGGTCWMDCSVLSEFSHFSRHRFFVSCHLTLILADDS